MLRNSVLLCVYRTCLLLSSDPHYLFYSTNLLRWVFQSNSERSEFFVTSSTFDYSNDTLYNGTLIPPETSFWISDDANAIFQTTIQCFHTESPTRDPSPMPTLRPTFIPTLAPTQGFVAYFFLIGIQTKKWVYRLFGNRG